MPEPFYLVGPTAVGKTALAVRAAELCGAEIVSADAFQVYGGLPRLTAQPTAGELARVPHRLVGHVPLAELYNVARYRAEATACLQELAERNRPALVVGGSGLYIKALTHGLSPLPPAQPALRADLEAASLPDLVARLEVLDPVAAMTVDQHNKRRVVRAVEICLLTGGRVSEQRTAWQEARPPVHGAYVVRARDELAARIHRRAAAVLEEPGIEEVRTALRGTIADTAAGIIGLPEITALLTSEITRPECLERIEGATRRYAKRQMTWFRREAFEETIHLTATTDMEATARALAAKVLGL